VFVSFINNINVKKGQGYWKLNSSVLKDKCFVDSFREWFTNFSDSLDICNDIWDYFKENIKTFSIPRRVTPWMKDKLENKACEIREKIGIASRPFG
jgi:hypothetical protein